MFHHREQFADVQRLISA